MKHYVHTIDVIFALVLFCVFTMSLLTVLITGAQAYKDIKDTMDNQYYERTCISYIAAKVRHYDDEGAIQVDTLDGVSVLRMSEYYFDSEYVTFIYYHDGYMMELFTSARLIEDENSGIGPASGMKIMEAQEISFQSVTDDLIYVECIGTGGVSMDLYINVRSTGGGALIA